MKITIRQLSQGDIKIVQKLIHEPGYPLYEEELLFNIRSYLKIIFWPNPPDADKPRCWVLFLSPRHT